MEDVIFRQAAIDEMEEYWRSLNLRRKRIPLAAEAVYMDLKGVVFTLPSAKPERKKGKWNHGCCSECGYNWGKDAPISSVPNYCPNCGEAMRKETEDAKQ